MTKPISQPEDKGIVLKDILEDDVTEPMLSNIYRGFKEKKPRVHIGKSVTIRAASGGGHIPSVTLKPITQPEDKGIVLKDILEDGVVDKVSDKRQKIINKNLNDKLKREHLVIGSSQKNAYLGTDKCSTLTQAMASGGGQIPMIKISQPKDKGIVLKDILEDGLVGRDKSHCLDANYFKGGNLKSYFEKHRRQLVFSKDRPAYRKLTPLECERLQTVPDGYTEGVSNTQRYKMLGNGWTVDVICHIFQAIKAQQLRQVA